LSDITGHSVLRDSQICKLVSMAITYDTNSTRDLTMGAARSRPSAYYRACARYNDNTGLLISTSLAMSSALRARARSLGFLMGYTNFDCSNVDDTRNAWLLEHTRYTKIYVLFLVHFCAIFAFGSCSYLTAWRLRLPDVLNAKWSLWYQLM